MLLPSCLTQALWEADVETISQPVLVGEYEERREGRLESTEAAVVWLGRDGGEVWAQPQGANGELALAALAYPAFCQVAGATLEWVRVTCDAELLEESSQLDLMIRLRREEIAAVVPELDLTPEARALLAIGSMVDERVPLTCRQCALQVAYLDLNWLAGRRDEFVVTSMVFVDAADAPAFAELGGYGDGAQPRLGERLQELSRLRLLVRLQGIATTVTLRLRPDCVWLASMLSMGAGRGVHTSQVVLQQSGSGEATPGSQEVACSYLQRLTRYERVTYQDESMSIWLKLALTPLTLACDIVFGILWQSLVGDEDDSKDDRARALPVRRSSDDAGPRRSGESEQQWRARVHRYQTGGN